MRTANAGKPGTVAAMYAHCLRNDKAMSPSFFGKKADSWRTH
ncbi:hypothetical protein [Pedobacter heparinus]|nr:hypothetical protein [Pedobacter heparinus]